MLKRTLQDQNTERAKKTKLETPTYFLEERNETPMHVLEIPEIICLIVGFLVIEKPTEYMTISHAWFDTLPKTCFTLNSIIRQFEDIARVVKHCQLFPNMKHNIFIHNLTTKSLSNQLKKIFASEITMSDGAIDLCDIVHLSDMLTKLRISTSFILNLKEIQVFKSLKILEILSCVDRHNKLFQGLSYIDSNNLTKFGISDLPINDISFLQNNPSFKNVKELMIGKCGEHLIFPEDACNNLNSLIRLVLYHKNRLPTNIKPMVHFKRLEVQFLGGEFTQDWSKWLKKYKKHFGVEMRAITLDVERPSS